jgi:hypothetical protein
MDVPDLCFSSVCAVMGKLYLKRAITLLLENVKRAGSGFERGVQSNHHPLIGRIDRPGQEGLSTHFTFHREVYRNSSVFPSVPILSI